MNNDHQYSINNLIEFGLSMSIAAQMIKVMNDNNPQPQSIFYAIINDKQAGPFAESEVAQLISQKQITTETYIWRPGMSEWKKAVEIPEILRIVALTKKQM